jgi:hypothetical protein
VRAGLARRFLLARRLGKSGCDLPKMPVKSSSKRVPERPAVCVCRGK